MLVTSEVLIFNTNISCLFSFPNDKWMFKELYVHNFTSFLLHGKALRTKWHHSDYIYFTPFIIYSKVTRKQSRNSNKISNSYIAFSKRIQFSRERKMTAYFLAIFSRVPRAGSYPKVHGTWNASIRNISSRYDFKRISRKVAVELVGSSEIPKDYIEMIRLPAERDLLPCRRRTTGKVSKTRTVSKQRGLARSIFIRLEGFYAVVVIGVSPASLNRMGASLMLA